MDKVLFIKMVLGAWNIRIAQLDKLFGELPDEQLQKEIAPGKNTGVYILGHLTAINNRMIPLLDLGNELHPGLFKTFVETPEKEIVATPTVKELRQAWKDINKELDSLFERMQPDEWFERHNSISPEDFSKEPHRNKLNVIISRTCHLDYHAGQLVLLK